MRFDALATKDELEEAVSLSYSYAETLRRLGMSSGGGNWLTIKKYVEKWEIDVGHFDRMRAQRLATPRLAKPLAEVLVEHSTYSRVNLRRRLYEAGLKPRRCELCAQGEQWNGRRMALILDHVNGTRDDNHLENLRIVCPNCAATFDTHCGRKS